MTELIFWFSVGVLAYVYAGYPALIVAVGRLRRKGVIKQEITPAVTLIVAAYNEEQHIRERLENALALDYPSGKLEILVASDGSTDRTAQIVAEFRSRGVKLLQLPRRGKIHALNAAVTHATGEILIFSDATSMCHAGAFRKLVRNFADPEVGGVCGTAQFVVDPGSESAASGERMYFSYDNVLKRMESQMGSVVSAGGCIYAIRRRLYQPIPPYVTDDFSISTGVVEQGARLVYETEAIAFEEAARASRHEFRRKVRMMTRGFRSVIHRRKLLNPFRYGFYSVVLFSHKVLRRIVPVFLILLFIASVVLAGRATVYSLALGGQIVFYLLALAGLAATRANAGRWKMLSIPFFYSLGNAAALVALVKVLSGSRIELWQPQRDKTGA